MPATIGEYKGKPVIHLSMGGDYTFSFGKMKAKALTQHRESIESFYRDDLDGVRPPCYISQFKNAAILHVPVMGPVEFLFGKRKAAVILENWEEITEFAEEESEEGEGGEESDVHSVNERDL